MRLGWVFFFHVSMLLVTFNNFFGNRVNKQTECLSFFFLIYAPDSQQMSSRTHEVFRTYNGYFGFCDSVNIHPPQISGTIFLVTTNLNATFLTRNHQQTRVPASCFSVSVIFEN